MSKSTFFLTLLLLLFLSVTNCIAQNNYILIDSKTSTFTVVDLKDKNISAGGGNTSEYFSIDLDNNQVSDLTFTVSSHVGTGQRDGYSLVSTSDSCTLQSQVGIGYRFYSGVHDTLSVTIPKIFNSLDTLFADSCNKSWVQFTNYWSREPHYSYHNWASGVHFVGFKKIMNNRIYLGWVKLELKNGITFKEYAIQTLPVGIDELRESSASIYPNPASNEFTIKDVLYKQLEIYNAVGEKVLTQENSNNAANSIDVHNLAQGIYFVKIIEQGKKGFFIKKFIKQ
jgi:hypothetical protein